MATRHYKTQQYTVGSLEIIATMIFAGAVLAGFNALQLNISAVMVIAGFLAILAAILSVGLIWYFHQREKRRIRAIAIADVDRMTGVEFEQYVGKLLTHQGYR